VADDRIVIEIDADAAGAQRGLRQTSAGIRNLGKETQAASRHSAAFSAAAAKQRQSLGDLASVARSSARNIGLASAAVAAHVIKTGAAFEQSMARVEAVTQASDKQMARLTKTAMKLGADTKYSAGQAADAMYELSSAGFTVDETIKALPGTLSLAASSGIELRDAAEISANALRGFRLQAKDSGHVADVMAQAVASSSLEMRDLQFSMKYIGPIASTTGQTLEGMTAALSLMADAGIKGEQAGTTLRGALVRLTAPTESVGDGLKKLGLSSKDMTGPKGLKPLAEIIDLVAKSSKGMDQASRNAALAQVFGTEALSGMVAVIDQGAPKLDKLTRAYQSSDGAAKKSADTMNNTVKGAFEALTGSIETVEISLYQRFQEPLKRALKEGASLVNTEGKRIEAFLERVTSTQEFKGEDFAGQIGILVRESGRELEKLDIPEKFGQAFSDAIPHIAEAAKDGGVIAAKAFGQGFINASPLGRLVLATWLLNKTGGFAAFRAMGTKAGAATAAGAATGVAAGAGGFKGALANAARSAGPMAAAAFALAFAPSLAKEIGGRGGVEVFGDKLLPEFGKHLKSLTETGNLDGLRKLQQTVDKLGKTKLGNSAEFRAFDDQLGGTIKRIEEFRRLAANGVSLKVDSDTTAKGAAEISSAFESMERRSTSSVEEIKTAVRLNMRLIRQNTKDGSTDAKQALSTNFRLAAAAVKRSMDEGVISTKEGTAQISALMRRALAQYGIKGKEASRYLSGADTKTGKSDASTSTGIPGAARGGFFLGQPGAKGRDNIPMNVNGQPVIAAEGEYVGIFNRHQQAELNALAQRGGYRGLQDVMQSNNRPHHMAGGGIIGLGRKLQSEGYQVGEHPAFGGVGRHAKGSYHYSGQAIDVNADGQGQAFENKRLDSLSARLRGMPGVAELLWRVAGHFDHLHVAMTGGGGAMGAMGGGAKAERLKRVLWGGPGGALGKMGQAGLDRVLSGAQSRLDGIAGTFGADIDEGTFTGGGGASSAGGKFDRAALEDLWKSAGGAPNLARLMAAIALAESSGNPGVTNSIGARGLWQVIPSTARAFGFDHRLLTDPLLNAKAAVAIHKGQGLGAWEAYTKGMHTKYLSRGGVLARAAAGGLVTGDKRAPRKPKPNVKIPGYPDLSRVKARRRGTFSPKVSKKTRNLLRTFGGADVAPFIRAWEGRIGDGGTLGTAQDSIANMIQNLSGRQGLTDEYPTVVDEAGNEVLNPHGMTVKGKYHRGIDHAVGELDDLLKMHGAEIGAARARQAAAMAEDPIITNMVNERGQRLAEIARIVAHERQEKLADSAALKKETQKAGTWEDRVSTNDAKIKRLRDFKKELRDNAIGHKMTDAGRRQIAKADGDIRDLQGENKSLRKNKPKVGKGSAARQSRLARSISTADHTIGFLSEGADRIAQDKDALESLGLTSKSLIRGLVEQTIPAIKLNIDQLVKDRRDLIETPAPDVGKNNKDDNGMADLLRQQRDNALRDLAVSSKQFGVFEGMQSLVGQRLVGAFSHGIDRVPETGLAYVHKDERILPQDYGPFGMDQRGGGGSPVSVQLTFADNSGQLVKLVDARVNGAVARVSQESGRRQRMITVAPGGR